MVVGFFFFFFFFFFFCFVLVNFEDGQGRKSPLELPLVECVFK